MQQETINQKAVNNVCVMQGYSYHGACIYYLRSSLAWLCLLSNLWGVFMWLTLLLKNWKAVLVAGAITASTIFISLFKKRGEKIEQQKKVITGYEKGEEIEVAQKEAKSIIDKEEGAEIYEELHANKTKSDSIDSW